MSGHAIEQKQSSMEKIYWFRQVTNTMWNWDQLKTTRDMSLTYLRSTLITLSLELCISIWEVTQS